MQETFARISARPMVWYGVVVFGMICVGLLHLAPHVFIAERLEAVGEEYAPYSLARSYDMTTVIGPRMREVLDGHYLPSDTDIVEYKDAPYFWPPFAALVYIPFFALSSDITQVVVVTDAVFTMALFLLVVWVYYLLIPSRWFALSFALLTALYVDYSIQIPPSTMGLVEAIAHTLNPFTDTPVAHLLSRRESFIPGALPLLLTIGFVILTLKRSSYLYPMFGGLSFALVAYTYPFHALYMGFALVILFGGTVAFRMWEEVRRLMVFGIFGGLALIPYVVNQYALRALPDFYEDIFLRYGIKEMRQFHPEYMMRYIWSLLVALGVFVWGMRHGAKKEAFVISALLLSGIVVLNLDLILGYQVQPDHWLTRELLWGFHLAYVVIGYALYSLCLSRMPRLPLLGTVLMLLVLVSIGTTALRSHMLRVERDYAAYSVPQYYRDAFGWLNAHTPPDAVVLTPSLVTNNFIPLYTHNNIFIPRVYNSLASLEERFERVKVAYATFGIPDSYLESVTPERTAHGEDASIQDTYKEIETDLTLYLIGVRYAGHGKPVFPSEVKQQLRETAPVCTRKCRIEYVFVGPQERALMTVDFDSMSEYVKVYEHDGVSIYKVHAL